MRLEFLESMYIYLWISFCLVDCRCSSVALIPKYKAFRHDEICGLDGDWSLLFVSFAEDKFLSNFGRSQREGAKM